MDTVQSPAAIVILGGGFGGLYTALRLSQYPWPEDQTPQIVLIDQHRQFVFAPLLYELVTGELDTWEVAPPFSELLANTAIQFQQATVQSIDVDQRCVELTSGELVPYDRLVLALGGETPMDVVPGAAEHAIPFRTVADAQRLQNQLRILEALDQEAIRVVVAGGGPSGVELACKLADRLGDRGRIRLVDRNDQILKSSPTFNQNAAQAALAQRGVWVDLETSIQHIEAHQVSLSHKEQTEVIPSDLILWTVGTTIVEPIRALNLPKTEAGRLCINPMLQVVDHAELFALGDLAAGQDGAGNSVPTTAQSALQQADCVAWNIWASLSDRPLLPFHYQHLGEMLTLGNDAAALSGLSLNLDGPLAYLARRLVYLYRMPTLNHQLKVGLNWMTKPLLLLLQPAPASRMNQ